MSRVQVYAGHLEKKQNNWAQISNPVVKHMIETWYNVGKYLKEIESI